MNNESKTKLEWALEHAGNGYPVFPLTPNTKVPAIRNWQAEATTDSNRIKAEWAESPDANIGSPLFQAGLSALDLDVKNGKDGLTEMAKLERENEPLGDTLTFSTASGGEHRIVRGVLRSRNGLRPGLDVKGSGGYIVMPGSMIGGKSYVVKKDLRIVDCPEWLRNLVGEVSSSQPSSKADPDVEPDLPHNVKIFRRRRIQEGRLGAARSRTCANSVDR